MKRRQRSGRELRLSEHSRENSLSFPSLPSSPRNVHSDKPETAASQIYGTQNSIFEILLPIEPRDLERDRNCDVCSGDTSHSDNDSDIDKKYPKNQFHVCKFCGIKEESCECIGCGDFDDSVICKSNDDLRLLGAGESIQNDHIMQIELVNENSEHELNVHEITTQCELIKDDSGDSEIDETNSIVNVITCFTRELQSTTDLDTFFDDSTTELYTIESESRTINIYSANDESLVEGEAMDVPEETGQDSSDNAEGQATEAEVDDRLGKLTEGFVEDVLQESTKTFVPGDLAPTLEEADETEPEEDEPVPERDEAAPEGYDEPPIPIPPVYNWDETTESPQTSSELVSVTIGDNGSSHAGASKKYAMETQEEEDEVIIPSPEGDNRHDSTLSEIPFLDPKVLAELLEADEQSARTAALVGQMKDAIREYQEKDHLSEEDSLVLNIKQAELMKKLAEFEEITQRVQNLIGIADDQGILAELLPEETAGEDEILLAESESLLDSIPEVDECRCKEEDIAQFLTVEESIPKVIVCAAENRVPRIIVCEPVKKNQVASCKCPAKTEDPDLMLSLTGRLSESYSMQERLASENAELEGGRYHLQEELLQKDNTVDALQRKVGSLQTEMRIIAKENSLLCEKLAKISDMDRPPSCCAAKRAASAQATQAQAPQGCACSDNRLEQYSNTTALLERQLNQIEGEVRGMQNELIQVQRERQQLEQQRKLLSPSSGGAQPCCPPPGSCPPCCPKNQGKKDSPELQLKELKEQYGRLQDDYKSKVTEVSSLRRDNDKMKEELEKSKDQREISEAQCRCIQGQLRTAELETKKMVGSKEQMMEQEQQLSVAKQRFREAQDELDELRALVQDQSSQLEDYRNKYLQAQQQVEEQRRQIDVMEMDNSRISDQVNLEIQRVKNQFQEKLAELTPLPDILKATQLKLKEAQQMRACAERNLEELARELQDAKEKALNAMKELEDYRNAMDSGSGGVGELESKIEAWEKKCNELKEENNKIRTEMARLEEVASQTERRLEEKLHEVAQLSSQLETVREESARQVARTKDRAETVRRSLQSQISDLERQLAQSRAAARSAQKDRDDIRQRMQCQISNLNENFDQAQLRIRSLQSHVNFLKTSYTNIFDSNMIGDGGSQSNFGFDTCDCNF